MENFRINEKFSNKKAEIETSQRRDYFWRRWTCLCDMSHVQIIVLVVFSSSQISKDTEFSNCNKREFTFSAKIRCKFTFRIIFSFSDFSKMNWLKHLRQAVQFDFHTTNNFFLFFINFKFITNKTSKNLKICKQFRVFS